MYSVRTICEFFFVEKSCSLFLSYSIYYILNYSINLQYYGVLTNISTLLGRKRIRIYILSPRSHWLKTWPSERYSRGNILYDLED